MDIQKQIILATYSKRNLGFLHLSIERADIVMFKLINEKLQELDKWYKKNSMQRMISISFTIIAVTGMIMVGGTLYLRFNGI